VVVLIETVAARGFRAGVETYLSCPFPGRFVLLLGGNKSGKTTICEALYLAHGAFLSSPVHPPRPFGERPMARES
jgi:recombinational DNA repair ATPase RecF